MSNNRGEHSDGDLAARKWPRWAFVLVLGLAFLVIIWDRIDDTIYPDVTFFVLMAIGVMAPYRRSNRGLECFGHIFGAMFCGLLSLGYFAQGVQWLCGGYVALALVQLYRCIRAAADLRRTRREFQVRKEQAARAARSMRDDETESPAGH